MPVLKMKPEGSYGFIRYKKNGAIFPHVAAWEIISGKIVLLDPQSPSNDVLEDLKNALPDTIRWVNLQGFYPTRLVQNLVEGEKE